LVKKTVPALGESTEMGIPCSVSNRNSPRSKLFFLSLKREDVRMLDAQGTARGKEGHMERLPAFQTAARKGGFVEVNGCAEGTVRWLRKNAPDIVTKTPQLMCIDTATNNATIHWMTVPGEVNSKTFRGVAALQEWLQLRGETIVQR
jgi:hypothetical protein